MTTAAIAQEHALTSTSVQSTSNVTAPALSPAGLNNLLAEDLESTTETSSPAFGQTHNFLGGGGVASTSQVGTPGMAVGSLGLLADDVESITAVGAPVIAQTHSLLATSVQSLSSVTGPSMNSSTMSSIFDLDAVFDVRIGLQAWVNGV